MYGWVKSFHIIFMVTWFAGLFYLPRLFVYHSLAQDDASDARFKTMERKLYYGIMAPGGTLTVLSGFWIVYIRGLDWFVAAYWLHAKLTLVAFLIVFHFYLGVLLRRFATNSNHHGDTYFRWLNEVPVLVLIGAVLLAEIKPWQVL